MSKRVGFIYLDEIHHIHHFLGPAVELSKIEGYEVDILTYNAEHSYLRKLIKVLNGDRISIVRLSTYFYRRIKERFSRRKYPSPYYIYNKHKDLLLGYDALVFTDHTADIIKKHRKNSAKPTLCFVDHGAGDRAYGYSDTHNQFDLVIVAGHKKYNRLIEELPNALFKLKIGGYSKFDLVDKELKENHNYFVNSNPVILYAPHFAKELSSWYRFGLELLEYFYKNNDLNLIFAPHINLFNKSGLENAKVIPDKYRQASNILIDTGSINSINMSYTSCSDVFIGDVSSQAYEYMRVVRPMIFMNAFQLDWRRDENYLIWHAGKVVESIDELEQAINTRQYWFPTTSSEATRLFKETYEMPDPSASITVARLIDEELIGK